MTANQSLTAAGSRDLLSGNDSSQLQGDLYFDINKYLQVALFKLTNFQFMI